MNLKSFLLTHVEGMRRCFNLHHFDIYLIHKKTKFGMEIQIDLEYLQADIFYWKNVEMLWRKNQRDDILKLLAHEITHVLLEELALESKNQSKRHRKALERATEHTSRLLCRLYRKENPL